MLMPPRAADSWDWCALPLLWRWPRSRIILKLWVRDSVENRGIVFPMVPAGKKDANGYPVGNDVTADVAIRRAN